MENNHSIEETGPIIEPIIQKTKTNLDGFFDEFELNLNAPKLDPFIFKRPAEGEDCESCSG